MRIEPTVPQKEETFQVVLYIIKASPCFKAFTITADVPEIYMQQFWFTIKKTKKNPFYEFGLADKKFSIDVELFRKILDIYPRVPNEDFVAPPFEEDLLAFLIELGYKGPLDHLARMFVDHMNQPWRTLATIINKSLSGKTSSNDRLCQLRVSILWGMQAKLRRREILPYPRFTKIIINHFLSVNPSIPIPDQSQKLKGMQTLTVEEQLAVDTMQALKARVLDESTVILTTSSEGTEEESEYSGEDKVDEEIEWGSIDKEEEKQDDQDDDDDRIIDIEKTADEEETNDEFVHGDEYVHGNVDEEMKDAEVAKTGKDDEEITNVEKTDESANTEINSLLDIQIQQEVPLIQSLSILIVPVLVIPEPKVLSPIPKIPTVTPVTTLPPPPSVTDITPILQQQTTPITTAAPAATTIPDPLLKIVQIVFELVNDVQELKQIDHVTLFITDYSIFDLATTNTCQEESGQTWIRDDQAL
ncbi:hypothetical protein Tco_0215147 [Tanacetum coccineum]